MMYYSGHFISNSEDNSSTVVFGILILTTANYLHQSKHL